MKKIDLKEMIKKVNLKNFVSKIDIKNLKSRVKGFKFNRKNIILLLVVIVGLVILASTASNIQRAIFKKKPEAAKKAAEVTLEEEIVPVKVLKIKRMDFKDTLPCIGNIKGYKEIDLKFQIAGIMESFNFEEGEKIQEGDIIASLVQKDALLKLKYAEIELSKNQKLFDIGAISQMKMDQVKLEYESTKNELDKTNIYAMSNGLLGSKLMSAGAYVTPNDKIGVFIDIDRVYAEFNIIERDMPKLALGQKAEVFVDAYPAKSFAGTVDRIAPIVEGRSRTENIKVELDNKDLLLKPGLFVRALIATYERKDTLVIPTSSLKKKEDVYFVYVIKREEPKKEEPKKEKKTWWPFKARKKEEPKPETKEKPAEYGTVEIRNIKIGYMTQDLIEVAEGLKEEEMIMTEVQGDFKDKAPVEITEVQEGVF